MWGRVPWSLRRWEALGEFAGRWWFLLDPEMVEAGVFSEGAEGGLEVRVAAAQEGVGERVIIGREAVISCEMRWSWVDLWHN